MRRLPAEFPKNEEHAHPDKEKANHQEGASGGAAPGGPDPGVVLPEVDEMRPHHGEDRTEPYCEHPRQRGYDDDHRNTPDKKQQQKKVTA